MNYFAFLMKPTTILAVFILIGCGVGIFLISKLNKNKHKPAKRNKEEEYTETKEPEINNAGIGPMAVETASNSLVVPDTERGYLTNVFRVRHCRTELIELKLKEPLGSGMEREPAVPFKGRYFAVEVKDKEGNITYEPYDPREEPVLSNYTPQDCYDATHWDEEIDGVYAISSDWGDKVNNILIGIAIVCNFIVALVALGKIGG